MGTVPNKYPYFGVPPARQPRPAITEPALNGKRVIVSTPEGFIYDLRAASEVKTDGNGGAIVELLTEQEWFDVRAGLRVVKPSVWAAHLVWVE